MLHHYRYYEYIPINDTSFELSVFWPSDTESWIKEMRFSDSVSVTVSLSFITRLTSVTCFCGEVHKVDFKHGTRDGKHNDLTSQKQNVTGLSITRFCG